MIQRPSALETLLDLDGSIFEQEAGIWIKVEAKKVEPTMNIAHGVKYGLTLHDKYGTRVLGYDSARSVKPPKRGFAGRRLAYEHRHRTPSDKGIAYAFESPRKLLEDFFAETDRVIQAAKERT
jgi:hypothetical protein